jgi:PIN like domain
VSKVSHLRDLFPPNTPDLDWLNELAAEKGWTIISLDAFRKSAGAERKVIRESGISVFVLQPSWAAYPYWDKTAQLVRWWPRIVEQANLVEAIAMEVPWKLSGKFKQL